jgi:hypothetical protein
LRFVKDPLGTRGGPVLTWTSRSRRIPWRAGPPTGCAGGRPRPGLAWRIRSRSGRTHRKSARRGCGAS